MNIININLAIAARGVCQESEELAHPARERLRHRRKSRPQYLERNRGVEMKTILV